MSYARRANLESILALVLLAVGIWAATRASAVPAGTTIIRSPGKIVAIPASIPHEAGDMVDRRILPDLRWIAAHYPIYVTDGYSGPLPDGSHVGCDRCHTRNSDHYLGLAVDLVPVGGGTKCDASWAPITRLAQLAEPVQNQPVPPFRWVGYNGDAGHGCGNHLHLSWNHAPAAEYTLAEWVEVFAAGSGPAAPAPSPGTPRAAKHKRAPSGGVSQVRFGGVSPRD